MARLLGGSRWLDAGQEETGHDLHLNSFVETTLRLLYMQANASPSLCVVVVGGGGDAVPDCWLLRSLELILLFSLLEKKSKSEIERTFLGRVALLLVLISIEAEFFLFVV